MNKIIKAPLFIILPRKTKADRKMIINLNNYRNWHYIINNQVKDYYKEAMREQLQGLKFNKKIILHFLLYRGSNRITDRSNVLSIHEKFFCDALTFYKCIPDDNDEYIEETRYRTGGLDRENPRVEITII